MEKIKNKAGLLEIIKDLRAVEIKARNDYEKDTKLFRNFEIVNTMKQIKEEEDKHIEILEKIIKMLEN